MMKKALQLLEKISPKLTAKMAYQYISNPQVNKFRDFEKQILELAKQSFIDFRQFQISVYEWGTGTKTALLVHGWEGQASNFGAIIPVLIEKGYHVISFDAPSHGNSSKKKASFFDFSGLIKQFLEKQQYDVVMTHSIGSVMSLLSISEIDYKGNQMFIFTTPDRFEDYVDHTVAYFGLTNKTKDAFLNLVRVNSEYEPLEMNGSSYAKSIDFKEVFIIHDLNDKKLPIDNSERVHKNMKNSEMMVIEGTGHFKMLWSDKVLDIVKQKITEE